MPVRSVVLVNESSQPISAETLTEVARALQTQVVRDFAPLWPDIEPVPVTASLTEDVPSDASRIRIVNDDYDALPLGIHIVEEGKPEALVRARPDWTVTASHEMLEMLADSEGNAFRSAPNIDPNGPAGEVRYLLEICDPCQVYDYTIGNVAVADFVTPAYYEPEAAGAPVDFLGRLRHPLEVPPGCSISWLVGGQWHQKQPDGTYVRAVDPTRTPPSREDRDAALLGETGDLRHDLLAARRAPLRFVAEALVEQLFRDDPAMSLIVRAAVAKNNWTDDGREAILEYQRFLLLRYLHPGIRISAMREPGDQLWHEHVLDTVKYRNDCYRILGGFLEHQPFYGERGADPERVQRATRLYTRAFGPPISALADYCQH